MGENRCFLLVHPEISRTKYNFAGIIDNEPLELEFLWTVLQNAGFAPHIWDGQVETQPFAERLAELQPAFVYICGRTRQEGFMLEYCKAAKEQGAVTMLGGLHAQHNYRRLMQPYVDYIFTGFDPDAVRQTACGASPENLDGICWQAGGEWVIRAEKPYDIRRLPRADRTQFYAHTDRYRYLELSPCAHVRTAYCCPYQCSFCSRNRLNCGVYTARDIADVVDEIAEIQCDNIYIIDDDFLFDEKRIRTFIRLVRERGIKKRYVCYGRADFVASHAALMRELKEIGFYYILTGLEATDDAHLDRYNKKTDLAANAEAVRILNETGIHIMGMFIVDLDFTAKDFRAVAKWIRRHHVRNAAISIYTPEMSSPQFEEYRSRLITEDPAHWDYLHVVARPEHMSVKRYYMHYHLLVVRLFLRAWRQGVYDFLDYGFFIRSMLKNLFRFGG